MADEIIGSIHDADVTSSAPASDGPAPSSIPEDGIIGHVNDQDVKTQDEHYGTIGQQIGAGVEGAARGLLGALAPAAERALGIPGEDISGREHANPITSHGSEAASFLGSLAIPGLQEASLAGLVGKTGEAAKVAAGIGEASTIARIASTGVKAGAELAALKTSDELSRMVEGDPSQTLGSAAINIGLAGIIGGAGGVALGSVSPLFNKTKNILGIDKLATDFMAETKALQSGANPAAELAGRIAETDQLLQQSAHVNPEVLADSVSHKMVKDLVAATDEIKAVKDPSKSVDVVKNYLNKSQEFADAVKKGHIENGLEVPEFANLNPTQTLQSKTSLGTQLARTLHAKGASLLSNAVGESAAGTIGAGLGALVGHPVVGAVAGERILGPIFSSLAKPLAETAVNAQALRSSVDYLANAFSGQKILSNSVANMFTKGTEVIAKDLIPDQESRDRLDKSLAHFQAPGNAEKTGGSLGHYLPQHATAAAQTAAQGVNYLSSLKPTQPKASPLDKVSPVDQVALAKYNRALDIAQQPLLPLKFVKDGTLTAQDVATLNTIYPGVHSAIINKITNHIIDSKAAPIPYAQRVSLSLLMGGTALDSTMTPQSAQAIMHSSMGQQMQQAEQKQAGPHKASGVELNQLNKVNSLFQTRSQSRQTASNK